MRNLFSTIAKAGKDLVLAELAKYLVNRLGLEPYGEFTSISLDSEAKQITFALLLKGEEAPVIGIISYHLDGSGADVFMVIDSAKVSREWMNVVFERHFGPDKRRFLIPPRVLPLIKMSGL